MPLPLALALIGHVTVSHTHRKEESKMASELQKKKWTNMFNMFDVNRDGRIDEADHDGFIAGIAEMRDIAPDSAGYRVLHDQLGTFWNPLMESAGAGDTREIGLDDWHRYWGQVTAHPDTYGVVRGISAFIFGLLDQSGNGQISIEEYRKLCGVMRLGEEYADGIFARLDLGDDGNISMDEMMQLTDQFFLGDDPDAPGNLFFGLLS